MKQEFLEAWSWMFGGTKKEALEVYKNSDKERIALVISGWKNQCKMGFYND